MGERGARTRQEIVDAAHALFEARGFRDTSVDDIATAADMSRATLYQYFESKEHLFLELVDESGHELNRRVRKLGPLGPDADGVANLRWWLQEWGEVLDAHHTVFVEWANITPPWAPVRPRIAKFLERHADHLTRRITDAGFDDIEPAVLAVLFIAVVERSLYIRHVHQLPDTTGELVDGLATAFQLMMFPDTPQHLLPTPPVRPHRRTRADRRTRRPSTSRFQDLPAQSQRTVRRVLDAGAEVFAENGFAPTNVGDIIDRAGISRGTFYKYFDDKLDLFGVMAEEVVAGFAGLCERLTNVDVIDGPPDILHQWLLDMLTFKRRHGGVFRAWTERIPAEPVVAATARAMAEAVAQAFRHVRGAVDGTPTVAAIPAYVMMMAMFEHFPDRAAGTRLQPSDEAIVEAEELFLRRGLLRARSLPSAVQSSAS